MKKNEVAIIGFGNIGQALGKIFKDRKVSFLAWDKNSRLTRKTRPIKEVLKEAEFVFFCVPSGSLREALKLAKPHIRKDALIITLSKGLEKGKGKPVDVVVREVLPGWEFSLLSGPMLANEIKKGEINGAVFSSYNKKNFEKINKIFENSSLKLRYSRDVRGTAMAGVLKNIYSIALGISEGLGWGLNARGILVADIFSEMERVIVRLGGQRETVRSLAGLGDLVATGFSPKSRNRSTGFEIGSKKINKLESEGTNSLPYILKFLRKGGVPPIIKTVGKTVKNPDKAEEFFEKLVL